MTIGTKVVSTRKEDFNGTVVPKGSIGVVVYIPSWCKDMVSVKFDKLTTLLPVKSLNVK